MRKSKQTQLYMQDQLRQQGIQLKKLEQFMIVNGEKVTFNIPAERGLGADYMSLIRDLDVQEYCSRYKWKGLPNYLPSWLIENMLYWRSGLVMYFEGDMLRVLPYAQDGELNEYSLPTYVYPIAYNGNNTDGAKYTRRLKVYGYGSKDPNADCVLLFDRPSFFQGVKPICRGVLQTNIIDDQSAMLERVKMNLKASQKKATFQAEDGGQANSLRNDINESYNDNTPFLIVKRGMQDYLKNGVFSTDIPNESQQNMETYQSYDSIRKGMLGYKNNGAFEKKERVVTAEKDNQNSSNSNIMDIGLEMRQLAFKQLLEIYPNKRAIIEPIEIEIRGEKEYEEFSDYVPVQRDIPNKE